MKIDYITRLLIMTGIISCTVSCNNKEDANGSQQQISINNATQNPKTSLRDYPYLGLRTMALSVKPDQIGIRLPVDQTKVFGVVMDCDLGNSTATVVSFISGDASVYLSRGGGFIGGREHENVKQAAEVFVKKAQLYLDSATKTETTPLPGKNEIKFYLLTNKGTFAATAQMDSIKMNSSTLDLFEQGKKVIAEIRSSTPEREISQ